MNRCTRCGRRLKNPSPNGFGPVCARAVLGVKPKRARRQHHSAVRLDDAQRELWQEATV